MRENRTTRLLLCLVASTFACAHAAHDAYQDCITRERDPEMCGAERADVGREDASNAMARKKGFAAAAAGLTGVASTSATVSSGRLLVFGGRDHKTFLGCLRCSEFDHDSIRNEFSFGNEFRRDSIANEFSEYGSEFSSTSACCEYASDPPVVVDEGGHYYGRLTINEYRDQIRVEGVATWLAAICKH